MGLFDENNPSRTALLERYGAVNGAIVWDVVKGTHHRKVRLRALGSEDTINWWRSGALDKAFIVGDHMAAQPAGGLDSFEREAAWEETLDARDEERGAAQQARTISAITAGVGLAFAAGTAAEARAAAQTELLDSVDVVGVGGVTQGPVFAGQSLLGTAAAPAAAQLAPPSPVPQSQNIAQQARPALAGRSAVSAAAFPAGQRFLVTDPVGHRFSVVTL